jgi:hypothetical protein
MLDVLTMAIPMKKFVQMIDYMEGELPDHPKAGRR